MTRPQRHDQRADNRQVAELRNELKDIVDLMCDTWPQLDTQAAQMGRGYPTAGEGGTSRGDSPVEAIAFTAHADPGQWALEVQAERSEAVAHLRRLGRRLRWALPKDEDDVHRRLHDESKADICELCKKPIVGKVKRIDNLPYCGTSCYFRVWRAGRDKSA